MRGRPRRLWPRFRFKVFSWLDGEGRGNIFLEFGHWDGMDLDHLERMAETLKLWDGDTWNKGLRAHAVYVEWIRRDRKGRSSVGEKSLPSVYSYNIMLLPMHQPQPSICLYPTPVSQCPKTQFFKSHRLQFPMPHPASLFALTFPTVCHTLARPPPFSNAISP